MMFSPGDLRNPMRDGLQMPYALDNGLFRPFGDPPARETDRLRIYASLARVVADGWHIPLFAVVPDVPYDGVTSRQVSTWHLDRLRDLFPTIPLAVAVQDGMVADDLEGYQWCFVAGSTEWKLRTLLTWVNESHARKMQCHVARVNTRKRFMMVRDAGADSCDGTGIWRGDRNQKAGLLRDLIQPMLFETTDG